MMYTNMVSKREPTPAIVVFRAAAQRLASAVALAGLIFVLAAGQPAASADSAALASASGQPAATSYTVYLPLVTQPAGPLRVDVDNRQASLAFYRDVYQAGQNPAINWTGSHATCDPGTTAPAFQAAVLDRINYFRAMAGVPATVSLSPTSDRQAQAAALMMSANGALSHSPPADWTCYSSEGAAGAGSANLYLGTYALDAITGYMRDPGEGNYRVGHRRWLLYPQTQTMGLGNIPPGLGYPAANALRVFDEHMWEPRPVVRDEFVAWPPSGYVPYPVVFARWSFSYPNADFGAATVTMQSNNAPVSVQQSPSVAGTGENTLVWIPLGLNDGANWPRPTADTRYTVTIHNVKINNQPRTFTYDVVVFDPQP